MILDCIKLCFLMIKQNFIPRLAQLMMASSRATCAKDLELSLLRKRSLAQTCSCRSAHCSRVIPIVLFFTITLLTTRSIKSAVITISMISAWNKLNPSKLLETRNQSTSMWIILTGSLCSKTRQTTVALKCQSNTFYIQMKTSWTRTRTSMATLTRSSTAIR